MSAAVLLALSLLAPAVGTQSGSLVGVWERDPAESDDVAAVMQAARDRADGRGRRGGGFRGRRPGGFPGMGPPGSRPGGRDGFPVMPDSLEIEVDAVEVRIHAGDEFQILYLDGEEHLRQDPRGNSIRTVAEFSGEVLTVTEKRELPMGDMETRRTLEAIGDVLIVRVRVDPPRGETITIRSVYRRVS